MLQSLAENPVPALSYYEYTGKSMGNDSPLGKLNKLVMGSKSRQTGRDIVCKRLHFWSVSDKIRV
jgi:hypothetical protein